MGFLNADVIVRAENGGHHMLPDIAGARRGITIATRRCSVSCPSAPPEPRWPESPATPHTAQAAQAGVQSQTSHPQPDPPGAGPNTLSAANLRPPHHF